MRLFQFIKNKSSFKDCEFDQEMNGTIHDLINNDFSNALLIPTNTEHADLIYMFGKNSLYDIYYEKDNILYRFGVDITIVKSIKHFHDLKCKIYLKLLKVYNLYELVRNNEIEKIKDFVKQPNSINHPELIDSMTLSLLDHKFEIHNILRNLFAYRNEKADFDKIIKQIVLKNDLVLLKYVCRNIFMDIGQKKRFALHVYGLIRNNFKEGKEFLEKLIRT